MDDVNNTLSIDEDGVATGFITSVVDGKAHIPYVKSEVKVSDINIAAKDSVGTEIQMRFKLNKEPTGRKVYAWFLETTDDGTGETRFPKVRISHEYDVASKEYYPVVAANIVNCGEQFMGVHDPDSPAHIEVGKWYTIRQRVTNFTNPVYSGDRYKVYAISELLNEEGEVVATYPSASTALFSKATEKIVARSDNMAFLKWNSYISSHDMDIDFSNTWIRKVDPETGEVTIYTSWVTE
jgi:hypothetical protein